MLLTTLLCLLTAAAPSSVAMPVFNTVDVTPQESALYSELLAARFAELGIKIVTSRDIQTLLGVERQRALMGCSETSCLTELAGALGVDDVLIGDLAKVEGRWLLTLKLVSSRDGASRARFDGQASSASGVPGLLKQAAEAVVAQLTGRPIAAPGVSRAWAIVPGALAVATFSVGLWCELSADARLAVVRSGSTFDEVRTAALEGKNFELAGHVLLSTSAAAALGAIAILVFGGENHAPTLAFSPDRLMLGWAWRLP